MYIDGDDLVERETLMMKKYTDGQKGDVCRNVGDETVIID